MTGPCQEYGAYSDLCQVEKSRLRKLFKEDNNTAFTVLKNVSRDRMFRHIQVLVPTKDIKILNISYEVADVNGDKYTDDSSVGVRGVGMDMGFSIIYNLSRRLFKDAESPNGDDAGYMIKQKWVD